jgi:hypothetical protein
MDVDAVNVVVSAVSAGAAAGVKTTASRVVTDAYAGLRKLIADRYQRVDVALIENGPPRVLWRLNLPRTYCHAASGCRQ